MPAPSQPFEPEVLNDFDLERALSGVPVTFEATLLVGDSITTKTGLLKRDGAYYSTVIEGVKYVVDKDGVNTNPNDTTHTQLHLVEATIVQTYGTEQAWTRGVGGAGTIAALEPRDHFAIAALQTLLRNLHNAESANDSAILQYSYAAYRWAQGMMVAAADSRAGVGTPSTGEISVSENDLQNNSEKLMYNINESIKGLNTSLSGTLKVDNPANDKFEVEGGGGASLNRDDVNDAAQAITDFLIYNTAAGKAPMRATLANTITKILDSLDATQKQTLYDAIKDKMQNDFDAKGAADQALIDAKAYTDSKITP